MVPSAAEAGPGDTEGEAEVSARDRLTIALWDNYTDAQKDQFINDFAHELAEEQRAFAAQEDAHLKSTAATVYVQGIKDAADLIDPKEDDQ